MRSVIIFALLALALCQSPMDIVTGFTSQLAYTDAQVANINTCLSGLVGEAQNLAPLYNDYLAQDFESLVADGAAFIENLEPALQAACEPVFEDLETYAVTFGNGVNPKFNLEINSPYVAQQVALLIQYVAQNNYTAVGSTIGYIYQITVGSVDLPSLAPQQLTYDQYMIIRQNSQALMSNQNGAMAQYLQAYIDGLGLTEEVNVTALVQLVGEVQNIAAVLMTFESAIQTGNFDSDITAIENFVTGILEIVRVNQQGLEGIVAMDAPMFHALFKSPVAFVGTVVYNLLLNAPELTQFSDKIQQDMLVGDFTAMGTDGAALVNSIYGFVYTN